MILGAPLLVFAFNTQWNEKMHFFISKCNPLFPSYVNLGVCSIVTQLEINVIKCDLRWLAKRATHIKLHWLLASADSWFFRVWISSGNNSLPLHLHLSFLAKPRLLLSQSNHRFDLNACCIQFHLALCHTTVAKYGLTALSLWLPVTLTFWKSLLFYTDTVQCVESFEWG